MVVTNQVRREVMLSAWALKREDPTRPFGDCLRGAWVMSKAIAKHAARIAARLSKGVKHMRLSPSLGRSAHTRATALETYARVADRNAGYIASRFGA